MSDEASVLREFEKALEQIEQAYPSAFEQAQDEQSLRAANARYVGPQGQLTANMKRMPELPADRRRDLGKRANQLKGAIQKAFQEKLDALAKASREAELQAPPLDVTLPGRGRLPGRLHPLTRVKHDLLDVFGALAFDIADGPEVDFHEYNFDKLGFPPDHPATDMQDSFFVSGKSGQPDATLLRTHTSTMQVREMLRREPPMAVVSAGAVYRRDDDITHSPMFMQIEGFLVDEGVTFAHLKGTLTRFVQRMFGQDIPVRFRPSYFPFVEPGGEVDIGCLFCRGWDAEHTDCRVCKGTGWIEILGCGMIHPVVLEHVACDPERYTGFAFGIGVERVAMLRYGIGNIRLLYENDPRFLSQF